MTVRAVPHSNAHRGCNLACKVGMSTIVSPRAIISTVGARVTRLHGPWAAEGSARGQALVEFSLVLPLLMLLLLTIGDFGRLFAAAITIESAAGAASETAAAEYLREVLAVTPAPLTAVAYQRVHRVAWQSVCDEASALPNAVPGSGGSECSGLVTVVCVHDGGDGSSGLGDPDCGNAYNDRAGIPSGCPSLEPGSRPVKLQTGGSETSMYVEVRVCYRFSTFLRVVLPSIGGTLATLGGDFDLERVRTFTVADY